MSGTESNEEQPQAYLVAPFTEVAAALDIRITKGRELRAQLDHSQLPVPERLEEFGAKFWSWHDDNARYLAHAFSTEEVQRSYMEATTESAGGTSAYGDLLRDLMLHLIRDTGFLVRLRERLGAYEKHR